MRIPLSSYSIETDFSITPFNNIEVLNGGTVQEIGQSVMI